MYFCCGGRWSLLRVSVVMTTGMRAAPLSTTLLALQRLPFAADKSETLRVAGHERLGEVLRILRTILEKYSPIQHNELLAAASHLISHVNGECDA